MDRPFNKGIFLLLVNILSISEDVPFVNRDGLLMSGCKSSEHNVSKK